MESFHCKGSGHPTTTDYAVEFLWKSAYSAFQGVDDDPRYLDRKVLVPLPGTSHQGGSVANVLSVGLRMFALATLPPEEHRGFLVLDEQDCWLRPELVPALVKIVQEACAALGFQVLMVSHHDPRLLEECADRMYRLAPQVDGNVKVELVADRLTNQTQPAIL